MTGPVDDDLCRAYREGCQSTINVKLDRISDKVDMINTKTDAQGVLLNTTTAKIQVLELNAIPHLEKRLAGMSKVRREPLGRSEKLWVAIIAAASVVLVEIIRRLL